jgi:pimeloyl-ACP methyl ester carboxylesterase
VGHNACQSRTYALSGAEPNAAREHRRAGHLRLPVDDPFYRPPDDLERLAPGEPVRSRRVNLAFFGRGRQHFPAWQLLYRSNDLHGDASISATTVVLPANAVDQEPRRLLSYQCAIDAVTSRCFPSYALRLGAHADGSIAQLEFLVFRLALRKGWVLSIPDHEGMSGAWGAPREPGYRTLDGVRAALAFDKLGLGADSQIGLWGYSGGGMATSWAAEMAPTYAPELNLVGAVLGSPVGDLASALLRLNGSFHAGLPLMAVAGLRRVYPALDALIREHATEEGARLLDAIEHQTTAAAVARFNHHDLNDHLDLPLADALALPGIVAMFTDVQLGMHIPDIPLLVLQAVHDEIISVDDVDGQVQRYRRGGARLTYVRDRLVEHYALLPLSARLALTWLAHRFEGRPMRPRDLSSIAGHYRELSR